jgi:hypothetical protein
MRHGPAVFACIVLAFAACESGTGSSYDLNGVWEWEWNRNPAGSDMTLSLATVGNEVTGTGLTHGIGPERIPASLTASGQQFRTLPYVTFRLTFTFASGRVVTYVGQLLGPDMMDGTWSEGDRTNTVRFLRH